MTLFQKFLSQSGLDLNKVRAEYFKAFPHEVCISSILLSKSFIFAMKQNNSKKEIYDIVAEEIVFFETDTESKIEERNGAIASLLLAWEEIEIEIENRKKIN